MSEAVGQIVTIGLPKSGNVFIKQKNHPLHHWVAKKKWPFAQEPICINKLFPSVWSNLLRGHAQ